ncbi:uncharacterized protein LOC119662751 [Teleopsis dalmanni]|uniref:uncharacterized protein LOC119662751 n=1 Tax=Teleopsis dalmanni TaxID=139649 RepID=UPI0018CE9F3C|nr:uncharacterized protein LOC119662751 [Teleopsis dalmanni]XP_037928426.1 uncharacterized protein LOC119662751 [Teleopsis dalmanni]
MYPNDTPNLDPRNTESPNAVTQFVHRPTILVEPVLIPRPILLIPIVFRSPSTPVYRFNGYVPAPAIPPASPILYYRAPAGCSTAPSVSVRQTLNAANMTVLNTQNSQIMPQPADTDTLRFAAPPMAGVYSNMVVPVVPVIPLVPIVPPVVNNGIGFIENNQQVALQQTPVTSTPVMVDMNASILHNADQFYAASTTLQAAVITPQQANINNPYVMEGDNIETAFEDSISNIELPDMGLPVFTGIFNIPQAIVRQSSLSVPTLNLVEGLPTLANGENVSQPIPELNNYNVEQFIEESALTTMPSNLDPNIHLDIEQAFADMSIESNVEFDDDMPGFSGGSMGQLDGVVIANTEVSNTKFKMVLDEQLFQLFYNSEIDEELEVAAELFTRDWRFHGPSCTWFRRDPNSRDFKINGSIVRGVYELYNTITACVDLVYTEIDESEFDHQPEAISHEVVFTKNADQT